MITLNIVYHLNQRAIIGVIECIKYQWIGVLYYSIPLP